MSFIGNGRGGFVGGGFLAGSGGGGGVDLSAGGTITGNLSITGTLSAGASTMASATVTGAATVGTTLGVTGAATFSSSERSKIVASTPVDIGVIVAGTQFDPAAGSHQRFNTGAATVTMTGAPIILAGTLDGQSLTLENNGASGAMTITDVATDTDGGVITAGGSIQLGALDMATFVWDATKVLWCQKSTGNN